MFMVCVLACDRVCVRVSACVRVCVCGRGDDAYVCKLSPVYSCGLSCD